LFLGMVLKRV